MNKQEITEWLKSNNIRNYVIYDDLSVDVYGGVYIMFKKLDNLPFQFGKVTGDFLCDGNNLSSLKVCPYYVGGKFSCEANKNLTDLEYSPKIVEKDFICNHNDLLSLKGSPEEVSGNFLCYSNMKLCSLEHISPKIGGNINCGHTGVTNFDALFNAKELNIQFSGEFIHYGQPIEALKDFYTCQEESAIPTIRLSYYDLQAALRQNYLNQIIPHKLEPIKKNKI